MVVGVVAQGVRHMSCEGHQGADETVSCIPFFTIKEMRGFIVIMLKMLRMQEKMICFMWPLGPCRVRKKIWCFWRHHSDGQFDSVCGIVRSTAACGGCVVRACVCACVYMYMVASTFKCVGGCMLLCTYIFPSQKGPATVAHFAPEPASTELRAADGVS
jgi:hypothetical protein